MKYTTAHPLWIELIKFTANKSNLSNADIKPLFKELGYTNICMSRLVNTLVAYRVFDRLGSGKNTTYVLCMPVKQALRIVKDIPNNSKLEYH